MGERGHQARDQQDQRGRDQPGDLAADAGAEETVPAGLAPVAAAVSAATAPADAAGLLAVEPAEAVVAEGQFKEGVVLRAADVGAGGGGPQFDDRDPPAAGDDDRDQAGGELTDPLLHRHRRADRVHERERRQDQEGLQGLGEERETDRDARPHQPPGTAVLQAPDDEVAGHGHQQGQHRVRVVEPEHQRRDGCERQHGARDQAGRGAEAAAHGRVHHGHGADAHQDLGEQDRPGVEAEEADRQGHRPQGGRGLVDGDGVGRVQRAEEERLPGLAAGLDGRRVEGVGVAGGTQVAEVEDEGGEEEAQEGRAGPARVLGTPAPQPSHEGLLGFTGPGRRCGGRGRRGRAPGGGVRVSAVVVGLLVVVNGHRRSLESVSCGRTGCNRMVASRQLPSAASPARN